MEKNLEDAYEFIDRILIGDERNKTLFDWSPEAIVIVNTQGVFVDANIKMYEWLGYKPEEVIGKNLTNIPFFPKKTKDTIIENFRKRMQGTNVSPYEVMFLHKDGSEMWGEIHGVLLQDHEKNIVMDLIMVSDVTERKKMIEQLRESEEKYRNVFEHANDLIQSVDAEGRFLEVNPRWLETMEYTREEVRHLHLSDVIRVDHRAQCLEIFSKIKQGYPVPRFETVFVSKTGREIILEGNVNGLRKDGVFVATVGIFRDITNPKK